MVPDEAVCHGIRVFGLIETGLAHNEAMFRQHYCEMISVATKVENTTSKEWPGVALRSVVTVYGSSQSRRQ